MARVTLTPMTEKDYNTFLESVVFAYSKDCIESGRWTPEVAIQNSVVDTKRYLPEGWHTPGNYFFSIVEPNQEQVVGYIWGAIEEKYEQKSMLVCDIEIHASYRRKGYATAAFNAFEEFVSELGIPVLELHVFYHNEAATGLYKKLGFETISTNMQKRIAIGAAL